VLSVLLKPWIATCRETRAHLSDYLDGDLGARTRVRIMRHLARCEHCRALLDSLTSTLEQLRSLGTLDQAAPAPATVRAIVKRIERDER
jgi:predicted anti-sigma-YlaC factor YlaD